ncbi:MAG: type II toxin-antitoxin system VapC family toxin [Verrucomicrobiota bacterium]
MIVVDTNVVAYLWISGALTEFAEKALKKDSAWAAPFLWRSEFRNVLAGYFRRKQMSLEAVVKSLEGAELIFKGQEYFVPSDRVMKFVAQSTCSAYDCEFVALADDLDLPLVTTDEKILREFPKITVHLKKFVS